MMPTADMDMAMMVFTARYSSASAYSRFLRADLPNVLLPPLEWMAVFAVERTLNALVEDVLIDRLACR